MENMQNVTSTSFESLINATVHNSSDEAGEISTATTAMYWTVLVFQVVVMIGTGTVTTLQEIRHHVKNSSAGISIVVASHIALLPVCTNGLIYILQLSDVQSLSPLIVTFCLGGSVSSPYVYCSDGHVSLSIVSVTVSTILAIVIMPLNLWLYSLPWITADVQIPYSRIAITFALLLVPLIAGLLIKLILPNIASIIAKVSVILGIMMIVSIFLLQHFANPDAYKQPLELWFLSWSIPVVGFVVGYLLALILRQTHYLAKTIAVENGVQSIGVVLVIIVTAFPPELCSKLTPFACMCGISLIVYGIILACVVRMQKCRLKPKASVDVKFEEICLVHM